MKTIPLIFKLLLLLLLQSQAGWAQSKIIKSGWPAWIQNFYTDESYQYLKLYKSGFQQLIRLNPDDAHEIKEIKIIFKNSRAQSSQFKKINSNEVSNFYGINKNDYSWFRIEARGINLNQVEDLSYAIEITTNQNELYYFNGITQSLLPKNRFTKYAPSENWIELGAFGATPVADGGIFFKYWEPFAEKVELILNLMPPLEMKTSAPLNSDRRFHTLYISSAMENASYTYQLTKNGQLENIEVANFRTYSPIKVDPMAKAINYQDKGGKFNGFIEPVGLVVRDQQFQFFHDSQIVNLSDKERDQWIIYQLWPHTFNPQQINGSYRQGQFLDIIPKIPYLKDLGINSVELLPINETRFHVSWGYALDSLIAVEKNLGTRDELKTLIDSFHQAEIRVLFDVVINHINNNLIRDYFPAGVNTTKFYSGDTPWGPKPRFDNIWVQKMILDSLIYQIEEFHIDGYRFDMTDSIFNGSAAGYVFLQELNQLIKINHPDFYLSAEQLPDNIYVTKSIEDNGLGFDSQWNDRFKNFFELEFDQYRDSNREVSLHYLKEAFEGFSDHPFGINQFKKFGSPLRTVNYLGSHDFVGNKNPFIRIVSGYRSQEQEDQNIFERVNPLEEKTSLQIPFRKIHNSFTHAATRLAYGLLFTKSGSILFYQGEELAQDLNLENEWAYVDATTGNRFPSKNVNIDKYIRSHKMPWYYFDIFQGVIDPRLNFITPQEIKLFKGHHQFFKDLIQFRKKNADFIYSDAENVQIQNDSLMSFQINTSTDKYFVIAYFGDNTPGIWIEFPENINSWWKEIINSSSTSYGGETDQYLQPISQLGGQKNLLRLQGPSFSIYKKNTQASLSENIYLRGDFNQWQATRSNQFNFKNAQELSATFLITQQGIYNFKVATQDWNYDLGEAINNNSNNNNSLKGQLTTLKNSPNIKLELKPSRYEFNIDLKTYKYSIKRINGVQK